MAKLGDRVAGAVRAARSAKNMTQEEVAEAVGITLRTMSRIESGRAAASLESFAGLVRVLELDAGKVLGARSVTREVNRERARQEAEINQMVERLSDARVKDLLRLAGALESD
jgi:transcriptional regulator with XRE-family HTH domain